MSVFGVKMNTISKHILKQYLICNVKKTLIIIKQITKQYEIINCQKQNSILFVFFLSSECISDY